MATAPTEAAEALTRGDIERRAAEAIRSSGLAGIVNPVVFCERVGISARTAEFVENDVVGMIVKQGEETTLYVSAAATPYRKRFTMAHELGHYFLHLPGDGEFVDREVDLFRIDTAAQDPRLPAQRQEVEANLFATAFLMPEDVVRSRWAKLARPGGTTRRPGGFRQRRVEPIREMARQFNVSRPAMTYRLVQLRLA